MVKNKTKELAKNTEIKAEMIDSKTIEIPDTNEDEKIENNPESSKKIVKKKIIKKKKKVAKKKDHNTINYFNNSTINDEDLMKSKINKIDLDNKLITEIKKINISTEVKSSDKNLKEMNKNKNKKSLKSSESKKDKLNYG